MTKNELIAELLEAFDNATGRRSQEYSFYFGMAVGMGCVDKEGNPVQESITVGSGGWGGNGINVKPLTIQTNEPYESYTKVTEKHEPPHYSSLSTAETAVR